MIEHTSRLFGVENNNYAKSTYTRGLFIFTSRLQTKKMNGNNFPQLSYTYANRSKQAFRGKLDN